MVEAVYNPEMCCYCGSDTYSTVVSGPIVPIIKCAGCGLMRQGRISESARNSASFVDYAGGEERFRRQRVEKEAAHTVDFLKISDRLEEYLPHKGRFLEIGCAMGTTLNGFRQKGWQVLGIEPEQWTCDQAKSKYGLDVICAPFEDAGLQRESFDVVLLLHVIEHLNDPFTALHQISDLIRPGGFLVLETPRYDTPSFRFLKGRERSVIPEHLHYFTRQSMLTMCRDAGFSARKVEAVGRTVTLDRLCFYAAKLFRSERATKTINGMSDFLRFNELRVHINLHDMMRLYLQKNELSSGPSVAPPFPSRSAVTPL
jgi:2-polyprenyl-3-methyl-5-hydroxy-6-metoxy-1,4-benzoquinol methylase